MTIALEEMRRYASNTVKPYIDKHLAKQYSERAALENPVSVIFKYLPNVFYLQPWEHGHGETKKTGFALHGLKPLKPTKIVSGREQRIWKMPPSETRKRDRSKTFEGVAKAIVDQWGQKRILKYKP